MYTSNQPYFLTTIGTFGVKNNVWRKIFLQYKETRMVNIVEKKRKRELITIIFHKMMDMRSY